MPDKLFIYHQILSKRFVSSVKKYVEEKPEGFKEYDLLCHLENNGFYQQLPTTGSASLLLFQKHFLLFHVLYSINLELVEHNLGALQISPLLIKRLEYIEAEMQIGEFDGLSEYYLDLKHLEEANEDNVNGLLDKFWEKFLRNDRRGDALKVLGLNEPVSNDEIIKRYRKLASIHHPDKGGDKNKIQEINEAYAVLIKV